MNFDAYFRASSYAMIASAALALALSGRMGGGLIALFGVVLVVAWFLEGRRWQLPERLGLGVLLLSLPLFYVDWKYWSTIGYLESDGRVSGGVSALVHLTLFLSVVKLLQVKADRDWLFLYLISFFEVLLAAGLNFSPVFIASLALYLFWAVLAIVCFEMRKARRESPVGEARLLVEGGDAGLKSLARLRERGRGRVLRRLPLAALCLLALIMALALPIFFITPRFGENALAMAGGLATNYVGFSEQMTLGDFGRLQQSNQIVMRVRVEGATAAQERNLRWRGVALDRFDGRRWSRSTNESLLIYSGDRDLFRLGTTEHLNRLTTQTFFLEPMDTPVLFAAPRVVALQGPLPVVRRDAEGALTTRPHAGERLSYRAFSDTVEPSVELLRRDLTPYGSEHARYLQPPPTLDTSIASLAWTIVHDAGARNRYDAALAIEEYLSSQYGYSLEMRAGGPDPLADFLFNVRAGHCEYFSSAMTVMLRTQGVAARVVNGFQTGEYNDAADAYTVRQSDAHSWVEVYFPQTDSWVTFDPTPPAGRNLGAQKAGFGSALGKYSDALELFWIQYVVAYDRQEQRILANSLRRRLSSFSDTAGQRAETLKDRLSEWPLLSSVVGLLAASPVLAVALLPAALLVLVGAVYLLWRLMRGRGWLGRRLAGGGAASGGRAAIAFYERMTKTLESRGVVRSPAQTPLEFAAATGIPEVLTVTRAYHRVRYGAQQLTPDETTEIENCLRRMEEKTVTGDK